MDKVKPASKEFEETKGKVTGILYQLETFLEKLIDEVKKSYALHQVGEKTPLIRSIEETLKQTQIGNLYDFSKNIDQQILYIIDDVVVKFFKINEAVIDSVYKIKTHRKLDQYYLIVLKEDTIENRGKLFAFIDSYDTEELAAKYPVIVNFANQQAVQGFRIDKKISL